MKKFREAIEMAQKYFHSDPQLVILYGDYGEILFEKNDLIEAKANFYEAYRLSEQLMKMINYGYGVVANWNQKAG